MIDWPDVTVGINRVRGEFDVEVLDREARPIVCVCPRARYG